MTRYHLFQLFASEQHLSRIETGDRQLAICHMKARFGQIDEAIAEGMFRHAAIIEGRNEDAVFYKSLTTAEAGGEADPRILHAEPGFRTAAVGDILVDAEGGEAWMCATFGWEVLSWDRCANFLVLAQERQSELDLAGSVSEPT